MKRDRIKNKCVNEVYITFNKVTYDASNLIVVAAILNSSYKNKYDTTIGRSIQKELFDEIILAIDNWDIRNYEGLRNIFPKCFPKGIIQPELTDKGWEFFN